MNHSKFLVLLFGIFISCTDIGERTRNYSIVNEINEEVELNFYIKNGSDPLFNFAIRLSQSEIIERSLTTNMMDDNIPRAAFESDSVALIFNGNRVEGHNGAFPIGNSIMSISGYEESGNDYTYRITQENYDNAIPCDGPCN